MWFDVCERGVSAAALGGELVVGSLPSKLNA
jgi:hypothetical protein